MDNSYKFCIACGAKTDNAIITESQIKCNYCGHEYLIITPIENAHNKIKIKLLNQHNDNSTKMMVLLGGICFFVLLVVLFGHSWNINEILKDYLFWTSLVLLVCFIYGGLKLKREKDITTKFLKQCNYDINIIKVEIEKKSGKEVEILKRITSKYCDIVSGKRSMEAMLGK